MYNPLSEQEMLMEYRRRKAAKVAPPAVGPLPNDPAMDGLMNKPSGYTVARANAVQPRASGIVTTVANAAPAYPNGMTNNDVMKAAGLPPVPEIPKVGPYAERGMTNNDVLAMRDVRPAVKPAAPSVAQVQTQPIQPAAAPVVAQPAAAGIFDPKANKTYEERAADMFAERLQKRDAAIRQLQAMGPMQYDTPEKAKLRSQLIADRYAAEGRSEGRPSELASIARFLRQPEITSPSEDAASKQWLYGKLQGVNRDREGGMALPPSPEDFSRLAELPRTPSAQEIANSPEKKASQRAIITQTADADRITDDLVVARDAERARDLREKEMMRSLQEKQGQVAMSGMERQIAENSPDAIKMRQEMEKEMMALRLAEVQSQGRVAASQRGTTEKTAQTMANAEAVSTPEFTGPINRIVQATKSFGTFNFPTERNDQRVAAIGSDVSDFLAKANRLPPEQKNILRQMLKDQLGTTFATPNAFEDLALGAVEGLGIPDPLTGYYEALAPLQQFVLGY